MVELAIFIIACLIVFYAAPLFMMAGVAIIVVGLGWLAFQAFGFMLIVYVVSFYAAIFALLWAAGRWGESRSNHDA